MEIIKFLKFFSLILLISSCAGPSTQRIAINYDVLDAETKLQQKMSLEKVKERYERLQKVGYPILKNNADLCENTVNSLGIIFNAYASEEKYSEIEKEVYEIDDKLKLTFVIPSSAAFKSGLRNNDEILSINGIDATQNIEKFHKDLDILRKKSETLNVTYKRKDIVDTLSFDPELICNYPILLVQNDSVNAFANGSQIGITTGMIRFAQKDEELGLVIAHELGHNIMDHVSKLRTNSLLGTIVDLAAAYYGVNTQGIFGQAGAMMYSQEFEAEADYVGIYYMERAGYSIENVADFWRSMAVEHPGSINPSHASTHPATPERFLEINAAVVEIGVKKELNQPIIPNITSPNKTYKDKDKDKDKDKAIKNIMGSIR
jgi:hypothetical protein